MSRRRAPHAPPEDLLEEIRRLREALAAERQRAAVLERRVESLEASVRAAWRVAARA